MVGAMESSIVIVWVVAVLLPQLSVAVQVLRMEYLLAQVPAVIASVTLTVKVPAQLSVAVTAAMEAIGTSAAQL